MSNSGVSASLRGNLASFQPQPSSLSSFSNGMKGLGGNPPRSTINSFKADSPAVTFSNPGQVSAFTVSKQPADPKQIFEEVTGSKVSDFDKELNTYYENLGRSPAAAAQESVNKMLINIAENKGKAMTDELRDDLYEKNQNLLNRSKGLLMNYLQTRNPLNPNLNVLSGYRTIYEKWMPIVNAELDEMTYSQLRRGGRKTFTRKYKNRKYKVSSKRVRKSSYKRNNTYRNKRHSRRH